MICNKCKTEIDGAYTQIYDKDLKVKETICFICYRKEAMEAYKRDNKITTKLLTEAALAECYFDVNFNLNRIRKDIVDFCYANKKELKRIKQDSDEIHSYVDHFQSEVWDSYLGKYYKDSDNRGHSTKVGDTKILMWGSAGRVLITLENGLDNVTMIFCESEVMRGGIQGIYATKENAIELIKTATIKNLEFKRDDEVSCI
jgi:hypothetical protein